MPAFADLLVIALLLAASAVFAAYEMALSAVSLARLASLAKAGTRGAAAALEMKQRMERSLAVVQLGFTVLSAVTGVLGGATAGGDLGPTLERRFGLPPGAAQAAALAIAVIPLAILTIVFAELGPKVFAIRFKERVVCTLSPFMRGFARVAAPAVTMLEGSVKLMMAALDRLRGRRGPERRESESLRELAAVASLARTAKLIGAREERIVTSAAQLSSRALREIALPAEDISMLQSDASIEAALVRAHLDMHTRFPIARDERDPQTIEGYVTFKDLVAILKMSEGTTSLRSITRPIRRIPGASSMAAALDEMVKGKEHIALVTAPNGRIAGMITLEDLIEELVGEIEDEFDRLPNHVKPTGDGVIAGGGATLAAIVAALPAHVAAALPTELGERRTPLADWVAGHLERAPEGGAALEIEGLQLLVRKLRRKRLAEAFVRGSRRSEARPSP